MNHRLMSNGVDECDHHHDLSIKAWTFGTGDKKRVPTLWRRVLSETQQSNAEKRLISAMEGAVRFALALAAISVLISSHPTEAWYKQATGPSYYSVGRASGLLSGIRRSPYVRRSEAESMLDSGESPANSVLSDLGNRQTSILKTMAICVRDISPNLQSCELVQDGSSTFQCKADVLLSLDSQDCAGA